MGHGRFDSMLGSYSIPGIDSQPRGPYDWYAMALLSPIPEVGLARSSCGENSYPSCGTQEPDANVKLRYLFNSVFATVFVKNCCNKYAG
jgi:hypothetical protein